VLRGLVYRLWLFWVMFFVIVQTAFWSTVSIILFLFDSTGKLTHACGARPWARVLLWGARAKVRLNGVENIAGLKGSAVLIVNHQSLFDVIALLGHLPMDFKFVVKEELMKVPLWGFAMRRAGYMPIARGNSAAAQRLFEESARRIRQGSSVLFFAEGTRSKDGRLGRFKGGGFKLACASGCPVLPVVVQGSREILPKNSIYIKPGVIDLTVLAPVDCALVSNDSWELMQLVRQKMLSALGQEDEPA
jgi:1-acyl-sn-glycerol-3-phosphate acyltransferase